MDKFLALIEKLLYTEFIYNINLYTLLSNILKYVFVVIVLRFTYLIVRMIYLDISSFQEAGGQGPYLSLLNQRDSLSFHVDNQYPLGASSVLGRDRSADIAIDYIYLSKEHARIYKQGDRFYIEDLASVNGTQVNGQEIKEARALNNRDLIAFAKLEFIFMGGEDYDY